MKEAPAAILDHLASLADTTRSRILLLLDRRELTVSELCGVMQLPQSTASRHLKALADGGWTTARAESTSNLYTITADLDPAARRLWLLVREQVAPTKAASQDRRRLEAVLAARRTKSQEFFSSSAAQWDRLREELFGADLHLHAFAALAGRDWVVGDLGCGTGQVSASLAPFVARVIAVDSSAEMLRAARERLKGVAGVEMRRGDLDFATLILVLHHVPEPARALAETARVVKPGGRVLIVDMAPHDRESYRQQMGHAWLGFSDEHIKELLASAGFTGARTVTLPVDPRAKGPALFVATAHRTIL
jgi:ArsR family transcriptional regulator